MAWLEQHPTSERFKICFLWGGKQFKKTVKTTNRSDADGRTRRRCPQAQKFGTIDFEFRDAGQKLANEGSVASVICQRWQSLGRLLVATVPPRRLKSPK